MGLNLALLIVVILPAGAVTFEPCAPGNESHRTTSTLPQTNKCPFNGSEAVNISRAVIPFSDFERNIVVALNASRAQRLATNLSEINGSTVTVRQAKGLIELMSNVTIEFIKDVQDCNLTAAAESQTIARIAGWEPHLLARQENCLVRCPACVSESVCSHAGNLLQVPVFVAANDAIAKRVCARVAATLTVSVIATEGLDLPLALLGVASCPFVVNTALGVVEYEANKEICPVLQLACKTCQRETQCASGCCCPIETLTTCPADCCCCPYGQAPSGPQCQCQ
jgi:hypothetical protein